MHIKRWHPHGLVTLHGNGNGTGAETKWEVDLQYAVEMFTLVEDRDRDQGLIISYIILFPNFMYPLCQSHSLHWS